MKILSLTFLLFSFSCAAQAQPRQVRQRLDALFNEATVKPQVMLLGTFHFAGEKVDANTTPKSLQVNMLTPERQKQIDAVVTQIARFQPTKIAIEESPGSKAYLDSLYTAYCQGHFQGNARAEADGELMQLGFRLAKRLGLRELFPIDASAFRIQFNHADSLRIANYDHQSDSSFAYWERRYTAYGQLQDSLKYASTLREYLVFLNSEKTQARSIGRWLVPTKRGTNREPIGADRFISRYYNRNLRIYSNVQRIVTTPTDRILIIYGNTHLYILKHLFEASPEFQVVPLTKYLH